jgi:hypothetical protein
MTLKTPLSTPTAAKSAHALASARRPRAATIVSRTRAMARDAVTPTASSSVRRAENAPVGQLAARDARELAPANRYTSTTAMVRHAPTPDMEFMTPSFAFYALCGVGCLLGSALSAVLLSLIPTLQSVRRTMDEIAYLAASVREEVPDTLAAVRVSGLELTDCIEEVGELTADLGGGVRSATRGITASVNTAQALGKYAANMTRNAIPEVQRRAKPIIGSVRNETTRVLEERANMEEYSGPVIANVANSTKKGVSAARNALKTADVARNVGRLYKTIRAPPARPKDIK